MRSAIWLRTISEVPPAMVRQRPLGTFAFQGGTRFADGAPAAQHALHACREVAMVLRDGDGHVAPLSPAGFSGR
jgi:hypothetical protein